MRIGGDSHCGLHLFRRPNLCFFLLLCIQITLWLIAVSISAPKSPGLNSSSAVPRRDCICQFHSPLPRTSTHDRPSTKRRVYVCVPGLSSGRAQSFRRFLTSRRSIRYLGGRRTRGPDLGSGYAAVCSTIDIFQVLADCFLGSILLSCR